MRIAAYGPELVATMKGALDVAWSSLSLEQREHTSKSLLASRILSAAAQGEQDAQQLTAAALNGHPRELVGLNERLSPTV